MSEASLERLRQTHAQMKSELQRVIVGQDEVIDQLLLATDKVPALGRWHQQRELVPQPKVVVAIEPTGQDERQAWCRITNRPHGLPVLVLPAGNLDGQIEETQAAIAAASNLPVPGA